MLGVAGDVLEALGHGVKEQVIDHPLILPHQGRELLRQGGNHVGVWREQDFALPGLETGGLGGAMAFGAAATPARVIRLLFVPTVVTARVVTAEGGGSTQLDGPQGPMLRAGQDVAIVLEEGRGMVTHDIGDFKPWVTHGLLNRVRSQLK